MDLKQIWDKALSEIELNISRANFITWFKNSRPLKKDGNKFIVACQNTFTKEWLENKYQKLIITALKNVDNEIKSVEFVIAPLEKEQTFKRKNIPKINLTSQDQLDLTNLIVDKETQLNSKYTFENFIVGANNELAQAAALSICENPGTKYNPLFIYGGVGLGKTHLLHAIGNYLKEHQKKFKIRYLTTEKFTEDLVSSILNNTVESFKKTFKSIDLLLLDDIQFITHKDKTQEILFSIFNTLYEKNKQIVFSSDRPPKAIPYLEERLRSRFEGGMTVDIGSPDFETRIAILKEKTKEKDMVLDTEIIETIAANVQKNVRELEGALNRVINYIKVKNTIPSSKEVEKIISEIAHPLNKNVTPKQIIKTVVEFYGLEENLIFNKSRSQELVKPRQIIMYLLRDSLHMSYPSIGQKLGGKDHTTVMHACEKIEKELSYNVQLLQELNLIKEKLFSVN